MAIIEVNNVVKRYRLGQTHNLRRSLARAFGSKNAAAKPRTFNALDGVDFKVESGEVLGIIGTNGAGKSTLLKVLAGITKPTSGRMIAKGRVAPLIEVGAGLIGDLTGRENVFLNGVILGMSVKEVKRKFDDIVGFAELEQFIDTPIKRYSSGMAIRLGFAIATAVESEILIVDEVLAVGDVAFQRKCFDRIENIIKKEGKTILLVSHNIRQVERLCTRAVLLDKGKILWDGDTHEVCHQFYERTNAKILADAVFVSKSETDTIHRWPDIDLTQIRLINAVNNDTALVPYLGDLTVELEFKLKTRLHKPTFSVGVHTSDMLYLATHDSDREVRIGALEPGHYKMRCALTRSPLIPGIYSLRVAISENGGVRQAFYGENLLHFQVTKDGSGEAPPLSVDGFFAFEGKWQSPEIIETVTHRSELEAA